VAGLMIDPAGDVAALSGDVEMSALEHWTSEGGGTTYPVAWRIEGPGLELEVRPLTENQEQDFVLPGWTGTVTVTGRHDGAEVEGMGTLQLTGYEP
jgi:predicted secreted hydrolase